MLMVADDAGCARKGGRGFYISIVTIKSRRWYYGGRMVERYTHRSLQVFIVVDEALICSVKRACSAANSGLGIARANNVHFGIHN